jgi:hypothetical protein
MGVQAAVRATGTGHHTAEEEHEHALLVGRAKGGCAETRAEAHDRRALYQDTQATVVGRRTKSSTDSMRFHSRRDSGVPVEKAHAAIATRRAPKSAGTYASWLAYGALPGDAARWIARWVPVDPDEVKAAAVRHFDAERLRTVVVGDWKVLREPLTALGWGHISKSATSIFPPASTDEVPEANERTV